MAAQASFKWARFEISDPGPGHLEHHARTAVHTRAINQMLGRPVPEAQTAPSKEDFEKVYDCCRAAVSLRAGSGEIKRGKFRRMVWCLAEAKRDLDRRALKAASVIALQQDGRGDRLLLRFAMCAPDLSIRRGCLGHAKGYGTGHAAIARATAEIVDRFSSPGWGAPAGAVGLEGGHVAVDARLRDAILGRTELLGADAASDEQLAAQVLRRPLPGTGTPLFPNVKVTVKDRTHGARRSAPVVLPGGPADANTYMRTL